MRSLAMLTAIKTSLAMHAMAQHGNRLLVTLAFLGMVCLHANAASLLTDYSDNEARVLILGAGASGLQAARTLHDAGMDDFIIVEADTRIGGRVRSTQFAGITVALGAQWAVPPYDSRTDQIVQTLDLQRHTTNYDSMTIRNETGHNVTDEANMSYERLEKGFEKVHELSEKLNNNDQIPNMSQRSALRLGGWHPQSAIDKAIEWFEHDFDYAVTPDVTSVREAGLYSGEQNVHYITDEGGFEQIFNEVAGFLQEPEFVNHTRLNQKVVSVDQTNDLSVVITCQDGIRYIGEYVLLTFSIGVLQHNLVEFTPPLPEWKDVEIKKFQMAAYTNIYLSFSSKFWDDTEWILYASERRGYYPVFLNYHSEGLFPDGIPMMLVSTAGEESVRVEAQPPAKTKAEIEEVLRNMYGNNIPEATDILVSDWSQNPLTKGSYSNVPVEVSVECRKKLESRVGRLFFGGEATSQESYGYIGGGLDSGEREARKMLRCLQDFEDCPAFEGDGLECEDANSGRSMHIRALSAGLRGFIYLAVWNFLII